MVKLPLESPTNSTNTMLIQQSLYAEKLDLKYRYRVLFSFVVLFIVSAFRTIVEMNSNFRFGALGTILVHTPWFISLAWCRSSWRAKRAKRISFAVLHQYMTVLPKNISGHYVKVQAKISHIGGGQKKHPAVVHITAIEPQGTTITVSLQKLKKQTIVYPLAVGDIVEIAGEVFTQNINNKTIAVIAAHSLLQIPKNQIAKKVLPAPAPIQAPSKNQNASHNAHIDGMITETENFLQTLSDHDIVKNPYVRLDFHIYIYQFFALAIENSPKCPRSAIPDYHYFYLNALHEYTAQKHTFSQQDTQNFIDKRTKAYKRSFISQKGLPLYLALQQPLCNHIIEDVYGNDASYLEKVHAQALADLFAMGGGNHEEHLYLFLSQY